MKAISLAFLVFGGLPLLAYPVIALADLMSLAGERSGKEPVLLTAVALSFQLGSLAHPAVYIPCFGLAYFKLKKDENAALWFSIAPLGYLVILVGLLFAWARVERGF